MERRFMREGFGGKIEGGLCRFCPQLLCCRQAKVLATMRPMLLDEQMMRLKRLAQDREEKLGYQVRHESRG